MPLRWGEPREVYDPEQDVGLPRPFILETKVRKPRVTHSLRQPRDPAKDSPLQPKPAYPKKPTFFTLPHLRKDTRNDPARQRVLYRLTKADIKNLRHALVGYNPITREPIYQNLLRGEGKYRPGLFVRQQYPGFNVYIALSDRTEQVLNMKPERLWNDQKALEVYALYLWRNDRNGYKAFRGQFQLWRGQVLDAWQKQVDEQDAQYQKYVQEWKAWLRKARKEAKALRW